MSFTMTTYFEVKYRDNKLGVVKDSQVVERLSDSWLINTSRNKTAAAYSAIPITMEGFKTWALAIAYSKEHADASPAISAPTYLPATTSAAHATAQPLRKKRKTSNFPKAFVTGP